MKHAPVRKSSMRVAHVLGPVSLVFLACYANACGSSGTSSGGNDQGSSSGGSSSGYGTSNGGSSSAGTSTSSSGSGDDATLDSAGDDSSGGSSSGVAEGGDDSSGGSSSGSNDGGQADGPDESGSSSGGSSSGGSSSGGSSSGGSSSGGSSSGGSSSGGSSSGGSSSGGSSSGGSSSGGSSSGGSSSGGSSSGGSSSGGSSSGGVVDSGSDASPGCDLSGAWAVKIAVHVTWPGTTLLAASPTAAAQQPVAYIWALIQGTQSGLTIPGTVQGCGLGLPDFSGTLLPETYGVTLANSMWDMLTPSSGSITVSNTSPTATYTSTANTTLIGIGTGPVSWTAGNDASADGWPPLAIAEADQLDMDNDGHPGVTATAKTGGNYSYPPITANIFALQRTDSIYMTLRSILALNGALTSCTAASGTANVTAMDNHIVGCHIQGLGTDAGADFCNSTETTFLDTNSPHLTPHAATFSAVKLTTAANCTDVRAALP